jgi:hypothetical protein
MGIGCAGTACTATAIINAAITERILFFIISDLVCFQRFDCKGMNYLGTSQNYEKKMRWRRLISTPSHFFPCIIE